MVEFWSWVLNPDLGRGVATVILGASVVAIFVRSHRGDLRRLDLSTPLVLVLCVGLAYIGLAFVQGGFLGSTWHSVAVRYWEDPSNNIPFVFASRVAAHQSLRGTLIADWLFSDRPPLQVGLVLQVWPLWGNRQPSYQLLATGLQLMWLPATWVLLRVRGFSPRRILVVCLGTSATGVLFVNSVYVWPKMLAGAFILSAFAILVSKSSDDYWSGAAILVTALVTLGLLAHGGVAFSVLALLPFMYHFRRRVTRRAALCCVATAAVLYVPWAAFQKFVDPPGDRLLKWQLAGVTKLDGRGFIQTFRQQYESLSPLRLLENKLDNLWTLAADPALWAGQKADPEWHGFLGAARGAQLNDLVLAAGPLLFGLIALVLPVARGKLTESRPLIGFVALSIAAWVLLLYGGEQVTTVIEQGSFAATVLFLALLALAVTALPKFFTCLILSSSALWFAICWFPGLGFEPAGGAQPGGSTIDPAMLIVLIASLVVTAWFSWSEFRKRPRPLESLHST